jgi:16S rRNA (cytosine967-C5)-methyltransferase
VRSGSGRYGHSGEKLRADKAAFREAPASQVAGLTSRKTAARLLAAVVDAKTPLDGLTDAEHGHPQFLALDVRDRALVRAILASALRHRRSIEALISERLHSPLPANATTLSHILHVGAAQILFLDVPDSAAVDLAVTHAKSDPRTTRFAALVNAVLRGLARDKEEAVPRVLDEVTDAPDWFASRLRHAYGPEPAERFLAAHRVEPPTDFTVKSDPQRWAAAFGGIVLPTGSVRVARLPSPVPELPGYAEGEWWVQDAAAALPARLLGDVNGLRVADLCAAPGGKTAQLAFADARVTAVDSSRSRLERLKVNLARLHLEAEVVQADVLEWRPAEKFDAILLDAPCSSTGTVRRHPDVLWTKSPADIEKLAALQRRLLDSAVSLLRPGGRIVFSNCSLDFSEGEELARLFLADHPEMELEPIAPDEIPGAAELITPEGFLRTTPADFASDDPALSGMDGFFAARLRPRG